MQQSTQHLSPPMQSVKIQGDEDNEWHAEFMLFIHNLFHDIVSNSRL
jgi:hypothetical protein